MNENVPEEAVVKEGLFAQEYEGTGVRKSDLQRKFIRTGIGGDRCQKT